MQFPGCGPIVVCMSGRGANRAAGAAASHRLHLENALENWRTQGRGTTPGQVGYSGETGLFAVIRRELHFSQAQLSPRDDGTMSEAQSTRSTSSLVPKTSN